MVKTASLMLPLGTQAPNFKLKDTISGKTFSLDELKSDKATVVMFICNHCPFVVHVRQELVKLARDYQKKGVSFIAINSNDVSAYPDDSPEKMKIVAQEHAYPFPYLFDETQEVARSYEAACTPDFYIFDGNLACSYRGQMDGSRPGNGVPPSGEDLRMALDCLLSGRLVPAEQRPSLGCNIKWR